MQQSGNDQQVKYNPLQCVDPPDKEAERHQGQVSHQQQQEAEPEAVLPHQIKVEGVRGGQDE